MRAATVGRPASEVGARDLLSFLSQPQRVLSQPLSTRRSPTPRKNALGRMRSPLIPAQDIEHFFLGLGHFLVREPGIDNQVAGAVAHIMNSDLLHSFFDQRLLKLETLAADK